MSLIWGGFAVFLVGVLMNWIGWAIHKRRTEPRLAQSFLDWFMKALRNEFRWLTGPNVDFGRRLAALGNIVAAMGILIFLAGIQSVATGTPTNSVASPT